MAGISGQCLHATPAIQFPHGCDDRFLDGGCARKAQDLLDVRISNLYRDTHRTGSANHLGTDKNSVYYLLSCCYHVGIVCDHA